jgi:hypothetical protein
VCDGQLHGHSLLQGPKIIVEEVRHYHQMTQLGEQHDEPWERGPSVIRQLPVDREGRISGDERVSV